jgi:hypothetical protein
LENVGWLLLAALGIMWAAFLLPTWRRYPGNTVPGNTVKDFERNMDLLAETEGSGEGRWIVTPRKGMTFVGSRARAQARARERRRRILVVLIESIVLTGLIGLVPPLRAMWYATAVLLMALGAYVWLLISMKARRSTAPGPAVPTEVAAPTHSRPARQRYAADASGRTARVAYNGLVTFGEDHGPIMVKPASTVGIAGV